MRRFSLGITLLAFGSVICESVTAADVAGHMRDGLARCAATTGRDERLACYDDLAAQYSRSASTTTTPAAKSSVATTSGATSSTPTAAAAAGYTNGASAPAAAPAAGSVSPPARTAASPEQMRRDFGLTPVQLRKDEPPRDEIASIDAQITGLGGSSAGRTTVMLDNGQLWELQEPDAVVSKGDKISIRRASLGSFLMKTPARRSYRVRRLQ